ncbi:MULTISPECIES: hypothetical protein [unclassified Methanobrevibacter]|jgi:hypothetical protein|uniref:hypothetical protein n=1 Tax=unclassified Methanobrevibacter TaxID=2638681 RepID=UPI0039B9B146
MSFNGFLKILISITIFLILILVYFACFFILLCILEWIFHIIGTWIYDTLAYIFLGASILLSAITTYSIRNQ